MTTAITFSRKNDDDVRARNTWQKTILSSQSSFFFESKGLYWLSLELRLLLLYIVLTICLLTG